MKPSQTNLDEAVKDWLQARQGYQAYLVATEKLFNIFAEGWCGPRNGLMEAFNTYRQALLSECGFKHLVATEVYPSTTPNPE